MGKLILVGTRVSKAERAAIGAAASLGGKNISEFLRDLAVPAAARELEKAARKMVGERRPTSPQLPVT